MLLNSLSKKKEDAGGLKDGELSKVGDSTIDTDEVFGDNNKSDTDNDAFVANGTQGDGGGDDVDSTEVKFEIDDKSSIDENNFELRIDNDDETEIPEIKFDSSVDLDVEPAEECEFGGGGELSLRISVQGAEKVKRSYLLGEPVEGASRNGVDGRKMEVSAKPLAADGGAAVTPKKYDCTFCEKRFPTQKNLKFHVLSHLKSFLKSDAKDNFLSPSKIDIAAAENAGHDEFGDFLCVLCEKTFPSKTTLIIHYKSHQRIDTQKGTSKKSTRRLTVQQQRKPIAEKKKKKIARASVPARPPVPVRAPTPVRAPAPVRASLPAPVPVIASPSPVVESPAPVDDAVASEDASRQYKCYICDKQFARQSSLTWHIEFHETVMFSKLKKNNAELENGLSSAGAAVEPTAAAVDADEPYRCQVCGKAYESLSGYRRHMVNHGNPGDEAAGSGNQCEFCLKYYPTATGLKRHIYFMHKDRLPATPADEEVEEAGNVDKVAEEVDDSVSSISDEFICDICDRPFAHLGRYRRHMNLVHKMSDSEVAALHQHTSTAKKCEACGKFLSTSSNLRKHMQKHCKGTPLEATEVGDQEFDCDLCNREFCSQRALSIHRAHLHRADPSDSVASDTVASDPLASDTMASDPLADEIPIDSYVEQADGAFQCTVCSKVFETRKGVIRHIGYHRSAQVSRTTAGNTSAESSDNDMDDEENIACPVCGKTFQSVRGMRIHAYSHREAATSGDEEDDNNETEKSFDCDICGESFEGFRSFKVHIGWHRRRGEEEMTPGKRAEEESTPRKRTPKIGHTPKPPPELMSGSGKIHQCQYCPRWFTTQQALAGHMKAHQTEKTVTPVVADPSVACGGKVTASSMCQVCGQYYPSSAALSSHMKSHLGEAMPTTSSGQPLTLDDTMECYTCGKFFMRKQDMAKHMRDHLSGAITRENVDLSTFSCIHCQKSFVGRKSLQTHQVLHEEAQVALKRTAEQQLVEGPPAKQMRPSEAAPATAAEQENLAGWDDIMPTLQCEECDRRLSTKQSLRRHMEWHAKMRADGVSAPPLAKESQLTAAAAPAAPLKEVVGSPFECLYCRKRFASKELLVEHTRTHEEAPEDPSPTVVVNDVEALGEHAVVQCVEGGNEEYFVFEQREGEAYQCSECDETHFDKLQMIVHMAYHVGKRWANGHQRALIIKADPIMLAPYECLFCDERFVNKTFRGRHMLKRHGDDVLQCDLCKKLFLSKRKLTVHCQQHFADSMYRCEHCLKCFTSKWFLKRHARKKCAGRSPQVKNEVNPLSETYVNSNY